MKKIFLLILVLTLLFINNTANIAQIDAMATTDPSLQPDSCDYKAVFCRGSSKIAEKACERVIGIAREYSSVSAGCEADFNYDMEGLACGDEIGLKVASYSAAKGWVPLETSINSNSDGTGTAIAKISSAGIYALVASKNCVKKCVKNVYDYPDPILVGGDLKLGVCGAIEQNKKNQESTPSMPGPNDIESINPDSIAPIIFVAASDECADGTLTPQQCPDGYESAGRFKYGIDASYGIMGSCSDDNAKSLMVFDSNFDKKQLKSGWVQLCTKKNKDGKKLAYLDATRNDCIYTPPLFKPVELSTPSCPIGSVICGVRKIHEDRDGPDLNFLNRYSCCNINEALIDSQVKGDIAPKGKSAEDFCSISSSNNLIATSIKKGKFMSHDYISSFGCNSINANIGSYIKLDVNSNKEKRGSDEYFNHYMKEPNYAICGGINGQTKPYERITEVYLCPIEQNKDCAVGYKLAGSIRVGELGETRCDASYESLGSWTHGESDAGKKIDAGLMGLCILDGSGTIQQAPADPLAEDAPIPETGILSAQIVGLNVESGAEGVTASECPTGYHRIAYIPGEGSNEENLDFAYIGNAKDGKSIRKGAVGLCVAENKIKTHFCSTKDFGVAQNGKCDKEEYCPDANNLLECSYNPSVEGSFEYYAFVCDLFECPSSDYKASSTETYYGKGNFNVCTPETCGLIKPVDEIPIVPPLVPPITPPIGITPGETPPPGEEPNNECVDSDGDGFFTTNGCSGGKDCDDSFAEIYPGAAEVCSNGIDDDCSGADESCSICENGFKDEDQDGACSDVDCDDKNATISNNANEICGDGIDQNCDGKDELCKECNEGDIKSCYPETEDYFYSYHKACSKDGIYGKCSPDYELSINPMSPKPGCNDGQNWSCPRQFGVCQGSATTCVNGAWPGCDYSEIEDYSSSEVCSDFVDNDCDGSINEGCGCNGNEKIDCGSDVGECKLGKEECKDGKWSLCDFSAAYYPKPESWLDNKDNDCDGSIDEGFSCIPKYQPGYNRKCGSSNIAPCSYGKQYCSNSTFIGLGIFGICEGSNEPNSEVCDDKDNDCDGSVDEGCACDLGQIKECGIGVGACTKGKEECKDGLFSTCNGAISPVEEKCGDSIDNDCDGSIDEGCSCVDADGKILTSRSCSKQKGVCIGYNQTCVNGLLADCDYSKITNYQDIESKCDDLYDNDCDGSTDEKDSSCKSTGNSKCSDGTLIGRCSGSKLCTNDMQMEYKCGECGGCLNDEICKATGKCEKLQEPRPTSKCNKDGTCDEEETSDCEDCNQINEVVCGDAICDESEKESCQSDCDKEIDKEKPKSYVIWYILLLLVLILIAGMIYYLYGRKKHGKKSGNKEAPKFESNLGLKPSEVKDIEKPAAKIENIKKSDIEQSKNRKISLLIKARRLGKIS